MMKPWRLKEPVSGKLRRLDRLKPLQVNSQPVLWRLGLSLAV
jgi:hypothetical protein